MIFCKNEEELKLMHKANLVVAETLRELKKHIRPGVTTERLDRIAEEFIRSKNGKPAFKGYRGYPATLCISINEEVVHGIPGKRELKRGDIVSLDIGVLLDGYYGDAALTVGVGQISAEAQKLIRVTEEALYKGIEKVRVGNRLLDVSAAIQKHVEAHGFNVVRDFVGHGIGRNLHEDPQIPNFCAPSTHNPRLKEGMVLALEPMVNQGTYRIKVLEDGWTAVTRDGKLSAHFEHTVAVTKNGPWILSKLDEVA
ncbi:MAG: type I methionyl aminopeptidase [Desulfobacterota bacterium]|nr:type I methionyl aminopeptidase [Thermodesulfobacteriota bacterium]